MQRIGISPVLVVTIPLRSKNNVGLVADILHSIRRQKRSSIVPSHCANMSSNTKRLTIEDLGYEPFFESSRQKLKLEGFSIARVTIEHRGVYKVRNADDEYSAKITGKQIFNASAREDYPAVGDWVAITELGAGQAQIHGILPRKSVLKKRFGDKDKAGEKNETQVIATNIDEAFIVESVDRDFSLNRFERYFAMANSGGVKPAIVLNKIDLDSKAELDSKLSRLKNRFRDADIIFTSTRTNEGLNELRAHTKKGRTYCFLGSSGVGKSSLINRLLGEEVIKTEDISLSAGRGKHTTTNREMYFLGNGGIVIDNPGMREVGVADASVGIDSLFDEITALSSKCKYVDCTHIREPGCEVLLALKSGKLDEEKYSNYIRLKKGGRALCND